MGDGSGSAMVLFVLLGVGILSGIYFSLKQRRENGGKRSPRVRTVWDEKVENEAQRLAGLLVSRTDFADFLGVLEKTERDIDKPDPVKDKFQKKGELEIYRRVLEIAKDKHLDWTSQATRTGAGSEIGSNPSNSSGDHESHDDFISWGESRRYELSRDEVELSYLSASEHLTERMVTLHDILREPGGGLLVHGYCHLRDANRTFRVDRIQWLKLNGQVLEPKTYFEFLIEQTPDFKLEKFRKDHEDELAVLTYVAVIGPYGKLKKEIVARYFLEAAEYLVSPDTFYREEISTTSFRKAVKRINQWPVEKRTILKRFLGELLGKKPDPMASASVEMIKD